MADESIATPKPASRSFGSSRAVARARYPDGSQDDRSHAKRDHQPRPARKRAPRAGREEDVRSPEATGKQREGDTHGIEVHPAERAERSEQEDSGRRQHDPQHIEYAPGTRDGYAERTHELQRDGDAERNAVDGQVERKVHQREREPEEPRDEVGAPVVPAQLRAHQNEQHERGERYPQEDRTAGPQSVEEGLGYGRPELGGDYAEHHERRRRHASRTVREARGDGATVGQRNRNLSRRSGADSLAPA